MNQLYYPTAKEIQTLYNAGSSIEAICVKLGISLTDFTAWREQYGDFFLADKILMEKDHCQESDMQSANNHIIYFPPETVPEEDVESIEA